MCTYYILNRRVYIRHYFLQNWVMETEHKGYYTVRNVWTMQASVGQRSVRRDENETDDVRQGMDGGTPDAGQASRRCRTGRPAVRR